MVDSVESRVVYLLMSCNQEAFISKAVLSALSQTYSDLEIFISDDASEDLTFDIIEVEVAKYSGPHPVRLNRNSARLGSVEHLAKVVEMIGDDAFIVMAHGDDVAMPNRTEVLVEAHQRTGASMISSRAIWLGLDGEAPKTGKTRFISPERIILHGWRPEMLGATLAFDPAILTSFPRLTKKRLPLGLDLLLPLRAAAMDGLYFVAEDLLYYRIHRNNMSNAFRDKLQSKLASEERYLTYEIPVGDAQENDLFFLARRKFVSPRHWILAFGMKLKQRIQRSALEKRRSQLRRQKMVSPSQ
ncbi:hypothetical protein CWB41_10400 [Methylovirgula ligni]|nr:hypothetical protein CWB41_10400 [Methylovirgula ligni]